jgi:hypothetical protein
MNEEIKVHVVDYGRAQPHVPLPRSDHRQADCEECDSAQPIEGVESRWRWEDHLKSGRCQKPSRLTREAFRERYSNDVLPGLPERTQESNTSTLNVFEAKCKPARMAELTTA